MASRPEMLPAVSPEFAHLSRHWDSQQNKCVIKILPGEYYVTTEEEIISTVLGSCVSACIRDPVAGVGGMNHFLLPGYHCASAQSSISQGALATRYGIAAMENLINDSLMRGARRDRLEVKLFGGGAVLDMRVMTIGESNASFARDFMLSQGIEVVAEDLGGPHPRKVKYFPRSGKAMVRRLQTLDRRTVADEEQRYVESLGGGDQLPGNV